MYVPPIPLHLKELQCTAKYLVRCNKPCKKKIAANLRSSTGPVPNPDEDPRTRKVGSNPELSRSMPARPSAPRHPKPPPWEVLMDEQRQRETNYRVAKSGPSRRIPTQYWKDSWEAYGATKPSPNVALAADLIKKRLRVHDGLVEAQSSLATYIDPY